MQEMLGLVGVGWRWWGVCKGGERQQEQAAGLANGGAVSEATGVCVLGIGGGDDDRVGVALVEGLREEGTAGSMRRWRRLPRSSRRLAGAMGGAAWGEKGRNREESQRAVGGR